MGVLPFRPRGRSILVVDDEDDLRSLLARIFVDNGFDVVTAGDGAAAIEKLYARPPEVVVLDLMMPGIDGWGVLRHAQRLEPPPPVVLLTVRTDYDSYLRAAQEGAAAFVEKPFSVRDLVATCRTVLSEAASGRRPALSLERRSMPRRVLRTPARVLLDRGGAWPVEIVDLGLGGARVSVDGALPVRDQLRVAIDDASGQAVDVEGRVLWRGPVANGFTYGVAFVNVHGETREKLLDLLDPAR